MANRRVSTACLKDVGKISSVKGVPVVHRLTHPRYRAGAIQFYGIR